MVTSLKVALSALAALTGGYIAHEAAAPEPAPAQPTNYQWQLAGQDTKVAQDRRVSVKIDGTAADVAKWLSEQGMSFVISDEKTAARKVMLNLVNQPLEDAMEAIAAALGGEWVQKGDIHVFRPTADLFYGGKFPEIDADAMKWKSMKDLDGFKMDGKAFTWTDEQGKAHKFGIPKVDGKTFTWTDDKGKVHKFDMPKVDAKAFAWTDKDGQFKKFEIPKMDGKAFTWTDEKGKVHKFDMPKMDGKTFTWTDKDGKVQKFDIPKMDGKAFVWSDKEGKLKEFEKFEGLKDLKQLEKLEGKDWEALKLESGNIGKLIKSLSAGQREKHKKQGYLTPQDLSAEQRKLLGGMGKGGSWSLSFVHDGEKLNIRSGK